MSAEPLIVEFELNVTPEQAFAAWTHRGASWWPRSHTLSGKPSAITFEPRPGGRIVERAGEEEHPWGTVLEWDPPHRLRYLWHLFFTPEEATEVEVTFADRDGHSAVRLEQRGWERLGEAGPPRRQRTGEVWRTLAAALQDGLAGVGPAGA